jgi:hypothetical protein
MIETYTEERTGVQQAVMSVLQYYSIFNYPLKAEEIYEYSPQACTQAAIYTALNELVLYKAIFRYNEYYSPTAEIQQQVSKRIRGNIQAALMQPSAAKTGRFIYSFPFVRFVGISGSLSKGYAQHDSDFDYFIVTASNRLWICRTILHLFKKLTFLAGQQHKFCMNYFLDESSLELEEKNRFTAIELVSMIPVNGERVYEKLMEKNGWLHKYLPNIRTNYTIAGRKDKALIKSAMESVAKLFFPEMLNRKLMHITDRRWRKKWARKNFPAADYELAFKTRIYVSKNHPHNHQKRILNHLSALGLNHAL